VDAIADQVALTLGKKWPGKPGLNGGGIGTQSDWAPESWLMTRTSLGGNEVHEGQLKRKPDDPGKKLSVYYLIIFYISWPGQKNQSADRAECLITHRL
jgi:hypothetical protein